MKPGVLSLIILEVFLFTAGTFAILTVLTEPTTATTNCNPIRSYITLSDTGCQSNSIIFKSERDYITFPGGAQFTDVVAGLGQCGFGFTCYPEFLTPTVTQTTANHGTKGVWEQVVNNRGASSNGCHFVSYFSVKIPSSEPYTCCDPGYTLTATSNGNQCVANGSCLGQSDFINFPSTGCFTGLFFQGPCTRSAAFQSRCAEPTGYEHDTCSCPDGTSMSPIVIDVDHSGFSMTNAAGGVVFDMLNDGVPLAISWTAAGSTNTLLVLDRNGNGTIDNGEELFGDITPQPASAAPNGFVALAEYDKSGNGGNGNGKIDRHDAIFSQLRLWQDFNHNGVSESSELQPLAELIRAIDLDYKQSRRIDEHGNQFRYRAKVYDVRGAHAGRWAWDVFVTVQ